VEEFTTVLSRKEKRKNQGLLAKASTSTKTIIISPLRAAIKEMSAKEEILKKLIQAPPSAESPSPPKKEKTEQVSSVYLQVQLNTTAMRDPLFAFSKVFETVTMVKPLGISLVSRNVAEILFPSSAIMEVNSNIPPEMIFSTPTSLSEKDVKRRAA
jgi:hypothetical protein